MNRYIDAERLKQFLKPREWGTPDERWIPEHEIGAMLDYFPAADVVEVRHGRWKSFDLTWGRSIYACTSCGEALEVPTECGKPMYEFCPNCGAQMDLDEVERNEN